MSEAENYNKFLHPHTKFQHANSRFQGNYYETCQQVEEH